MTTRKRLVSPGEVEAHLENLRKLGVPIGAVDIRADGVTVHPPIESQGGSAYDRWKAKDANRDQAAYRS